MSGRRVLVTGSSRGIGAAVARAFAEAGDTVAIHHRDSAGLAAQLLADLPGTGHLVVQGDLAHAEQVATMVAAAADGLDGLDVLVNNAGIFTAHPPMGTDWPAWQQAWSQTLAVNLTAAAHAVFCALPHLVAAGGGAVVNVGSRGAFRGEPDCPAYGASKAGLHALGQSLALSLAPHGISVTTVAPGFVDTDMAAELLEGPTGDSIRAQSPFNRVATADEVAGAVLWLASPGAQFSSGAVLDLNGASYLRT